MAFLSSCLNQATTMLLNLLAPPYCAHCKAFLNERFPLCADCLENIRPLVSETLKITASTSATVHALGAYEEPLQTLIRAKNYHNAIASKQLGELLYFRFEQLIKQHDIMVPMPLHWTRYASRGFNQAAVMAQTISKKAGIPVVPLLQRRKRTKFQARLSALQRAENVHEAFILSDNAHYFKNKKILLLDDLMTTGSTLTAAGRVLLKNKPDLITILVTARVP